MQPGQAPPSPHPAPPQPVPGQAPPYGPPPGPAPDRSRPPNGRRIGAWAVDAAVVLAIAAGLWGLAFDHLGSVLPTHLSTQAAESVYGLLFSGGDVESVVRELGARAWRDVVATVQRTILLIILAEFAYHFALVLWKGRTLGRMVADLKVRRAGAAPETAPAGKRAFLAVSGPGLPASLVRALATAAAGTGLYGAAWILLVHGQFLPSVLVWLLSVGLLVLNIVLALAGKRRSVSDRIARTAIVRTTGYAQAAQAAVDAGRYLQATGAATAQTARQGAERLAQNPAVGQFKDKGREQIDRALAGRQAQQLGQAGRRFADRVKTAYEEKARPRRSEASAEGPPPPVPPGAPPVPPGPQAPGTPPARPGPPLPPGP